MNLFITGATGFLGKSLVQKIYPDANKLYILVRPESIGKAKKFYSTFDHIKIIRGDLSDPEILIDSSDFELLADIDQVIHLGGKYDIQMSFTEAYIENVVGVQNLLNLIRKMPNCRQFHHISSFSVIGVDLPHANEDKFAQKESSLSAYAKSKSIGEKLVRNTNLPGVDKIIYRPGIIVGSKDTPIEKIDGPYYFIKKLIDFKFIVCRLPKKIWLTIPMDSSAYLPLIEVDLVAKFIRQKILDNKLKDLETFYIVSRNKVFIKKLLEELFLLYQIKIKIISLPKFLGKKIKIGLGIPKELNDYFYFKTTMLDQKNKTDLELLDASTICAKVLNDQMIQLKRGELR